MFVASPEYQYSTHRLVSVGAYDAAMTTVQDEDGYVMLVITRLAHGAPIPTGTTAREHVFVLAEERARQRVAERGFTPGAQEVWLFTSQGWEPVKGDPGSA